MNRFEERFSTLQVSGKKALVVYIVAGDPASETTVRLMHEMVSQGADIIELGVPFTDPEAEGPVIQLGHERALRARTTLTDTLAMARAFRQQDKKTPIALNPPALDLGNLTPTKPKNVPTRILKGYIK